MPLFDFCGELTKRTSSFANRQSFSNRTVIHSGHGDFAGAFAMTLTVLRVVPRALVNLNVPVFKVR